MSAVSRLHKIDLKNETDPYELFREWQSDFKRETNAFQSMVMNIATVSKDGVVSSRSVLMRELTDEGFMFNTTRRSRKYEDIQNHPQVSLCFYWTVNVNGEVLTRQVRVEGEAREMPEEFTRASFRRWSLRTKMRYGFCKQGNEIDWEELKKRHEKYFKEHENAKVEDFEMPAVAVFYTVIPNRIEYYSSVLDAITIGDRVLFRRNNGNDGWYAVHVEA